MATRITENRGGKVSINQDVIIQKNKIIEIKEKIKIILAD
jgi:hypothetical protein